MFINWFLTLLLSYMTASWFFVFYREKAFSEHLLRTGVGWVLGWKLKKDQKSGFFPKKAEKALFFAFPEHTLFWKCAHARVTAVSFGVFQELISLWYRGVFFGLFGVFAAFCPFWGLFGGRSNEGRSASDLVEFGPPAAYQFWDRRALEGPTPLLSWVDVRLMLSPFLHYMAFNYSLGVV